MDTRIIAPNAAELYRKAADFYGELPAFATRNKALEWTPVSFRELYEQGLDLASGLIELNVQSRDHVGIFGDNRFEWILADYGVQLCGAANVPRGRDITSEEITYIVNHAQIEVVFVETQKLQDKVLELWHEMPELKEIILIDPKSRPAEGVKHLKEVIAIGKHTREQGKKYPEERIRNIREGDLFTLIYTSGTTGTPKGVMISHSNVMSQVKNIPIHLDFTDRVLSILPVWHVLERIIEIFSISCGTCTYYTSLRTLQEDMVNVEPTFMGSAPRLWETLNHKILEGVKDSHPMRQVLFHIAYFLGYHYHESLFALADNKLKMKPDNPVKKSFSYAFNALRWLFIVPWYGFFNATVLEQIRKKVGGSLKGTISGGGALSTDIDKFFNYIGITVLEGYGLTETAPVISVRTIDKTVIGTVGPPVPETQIRIVDPETSEILYPNPKYPDEGRTLRGEIWAKGPQVMKGYYRQPELTEKASHDGWFRTGDLGMMTYNDCLKIVGRLKSTIVLLNGENIEPEPIELELCQSPYIDYCMITGQDQNFLGVLVKPNLDEFAKIGIQAQNIKDIKSNEEAQKVIYNEIRKKVNNAEKFKNYEKIKNFEMVPEEFEVGNELTNLFKVKRHVVENKYAELIKEIHHQPVKA